MKKWITAALVTMMVPVAAMAQTKIGVAMAHFDDNFLTILRGGMQKHAQEIKGVSLQFEDARGDVGRQVSQVETFIAVETDITARVETERELRRAKVRYGISSACVGGGQGMAMIVERLS